MWFFYKNLKYDSVRLNPIMVSHTVLKLVDNISLVEIKSAGRNKKFRSLSQLFWEGQQSLYHSHGCFWNT